jgi:hypothetical protein
MRGEGVLLNGERTCGDIDRVSEFNEAKAGMAK